MNDEQLLAGWQEFSKKIPLLVNDGKLQDAYAFVRIETLPNGSMVTHMLAYNLDELKHIGMVAYHLQSLDKHLQQTSAPEHRHNISRVLNLFNKLFSAKVDVTDKRELN